MSLESLHIPNIIDMAMVDISKMKYGKAAGKLSIVVEMSRAAGDNLYLPKTSIKASDQNHVV